MNSFISNNYNECNKLSSIIGVYVQIVVYLKTNPSNNYIEYNNLLPYICDIKDIDKIIDFLDKNRFIKIIEKRYITLYSRYYKEKFIADFLKARNINENSLYTNEIVNLN